MGEGFIKASELLKENRRFQSELYSILIYPIFIMVISTIIIGFIMIFIIPNFLDLYGENIEKLPLITKIILFVYNNILSISILCFILFFLLLLFVKKGKVVLFKNFLLERDMVFFLENLGLLLESGLSIDKSIEIVIDGLKHRKDIYLLKGIKSGINFSDILEKLGGLSEIEIALIRLAENTGRLPEILKEISEDKKEKIRSKFKIIIKISEPFLLLIIGIIISFFVIGLYVPILNFSDSLGI